MRKSNFCLSKKSSKKQINNVSNVYNFTPIQYENKFKMKNFNQ